MLSYNAPGSDLAPTPTAPGGAKACSICADAGRASAAARSGPPQSGSGQHAHVAHLAVVGLHTLCCGLPIAAGAFVALAGAGVGGVALLANDLHKVLHGYEAWVLAGSAALLGLGLWLEARGRRGRRNRGVPWLLMASAAAFLVNAAVFIGHHGPNHPLNPAPVLAAEAGLGGQGAPPIVVAASAEAPYAAAPDQTLHDHSH